MTVDTELSATDVEETVSPAPTSEAVASADACECAEQGTIECTGNGVICCWATDPCCEPCC